MNFRTLSLSVLLLVLAAAGSADAQKIELASMMCKKFSMLAKDTQWTVTSWLAGYYTDEEDPAVVEVDKLKGKAEQLVSFCTENPNANLLAAAEDVLVK
jgi:hypothetical protein